MEDLTAAKSDYNYRDETFVLTGVSAASLTPEPSSFALLGTGLLSLAGMGTS